MPSSPSADLIGLIRTMVSTGTPPATIATRAHAPESVVKHVIEFDTLPNEELGPLWQSEPRQPTPAAKVSDR